MDWMEIMYLACFFLGLGFAILSGLLSGVFSGGAEAHIDVGGVHTDFGGHGVPSDGSVHFSPLSPVTLAMFLATFGGSGIIFKKVLAWPPLAHIPASAISGVAMAAAVFYLFYRVFALTQSSSSGSEAEAVGLEAEIVVPIPNGGLGEIAYTLRGSRMTVPARTADGKELPARIIVKVVKQVGNTFIVQKT